MNTTSITVAPISKIHSYHAHIYFNDATQRERAAALRELVAERFAVQLGRWRETPVGPHTSPMYQIAFDLAVFPVLVPWLMLNRRDLTVFVHPNTDNPRRDHATHALWMGQVLPLHTAMLAESIADDPLQPIEPNTTPTIAA
jgi:aromatic ring-cleaving dioxygenase